MRLDVMEAGSEFAADSLQVSDLVCKDLCQVTQAQSAVPFARHRLQDIRPAKAGPVRVRRMRTNGDVMPNRQSDRATHTGCISRMAAAGNICGTDKRKDGFVGGHPLSHITIEIDAQHTISLR